MIDDDDFGVSCREVGQHLARVVGTGVVVFVGEAPASAQNAARIKVCPNGCEYATIQDAINAAPDGAKIIIAPGAYGGFTVPGTNSGLTKVTLVGAGAGVTTVGGVHVVIDSGESATIRGVTITGASPPFGEYNGGGIDNSGTLTLDDSTVSKNTAMGGAGILNSGKLILRDSTVSKNSGRGGGGILNWGTATLKNSTISGNGAEVGGGVSNGGTLTLKDSTVSGNVASQDGGGIYEYSSATATATVTVTVTESMISGNAPENCWPLGSVADCVG